MTEIHQCYHLPLASSSNTYDTFVLQIPIYVKHYQQQTLDLFSLQTLPEPYHPNRKSSGQKHSQTW